MFLFSSAGYLQNYVFKINHPRPPSECETVWIQIKTTFCWSSSGFKLFAKGYWQTTKLSTCMQRVITGKYFSVQYIVSYRDIHAYVYHKYSDTLNTFNMLCPLNKAKIIFKGSSKNQFYFPMLNGTLSFLQKYVFLLLSFQFCIIYGTCSQKCTGSF